MRLTPRTLFIALLLALAPWPDAQEQAKGTRKDGLPLKDWKLPEGDTRKPAEIYRALRKARDDEMRGRGEEDFKKSDLDGSGWISFREGEATLGLDRDRFLTYDLNQDGRLGPREFGIHFSRTLQRTGSVRPPAETPAEADAPKPYPPPPSEELEPYPSVQDLLRLYDRDRSHGLDEKEVGTLFVDVQLALSPQVVVRQMDPNESGELEQQELAPIASLVRDTLLRANPDVAQVPIQVIEELYAETAPKPPKAQNLPPRIAGPATHFRRLDLFGDGFIDPAELEELVPPTRMRVRASAIVSALDTNGDGRLDADEFRSSMRHD